MKYSECKKGHLYCLKRYDDVWLVIFEHILNGELYVTWAYSLDSNTLYNKQDCGIFTDDMESYTFAEPTAEEIKKFNDKTGLNYSSLNEGYEVY